MIKSAVEEFKQLRDKGVAPTWLETAIPLRIDRYEPRLDRFYLVNFWPDFLKRYENKPVIKIDKKRISVVLKKIRKESLKKNIDPKRIIFAKNIPHDEHLERIKHVDLFLDTFNCNAHTTCSDTLWSGTPIVTKIGDQFAARVASSLLKSMNLNELITTSNTEYENLIIELANNKDKLKKIKDKISNNLSKSSLFKLDINSVNSKCFAPEPLGLLPK